MKTTTTTMTVVIVTAILACMISTVESQFAHSLDGSDPTLAISKLIDPFFCQSLKGKYPKKYLFKAAPSKDLILQAKHRLLAGKMLARQLKSLSSGLYDRRNAGNVFEQPIMMTMMPKSVHQQQQQQQQQIQLNHLPQTMTNIQFPIDMQILRTLAQTDGSRTANEHWSQRCTCRPPGSFSAGSMVPNQVALSHGPACSCPCHLGA